MKRIENIKKSNASIFANLRLSTHIFFADWRNRFATAWFFAIAAVLAITLPQITPYISWPSNNQYGDDRIEVIDVKSKLPTLELYEGENFTAQVPQGWTIAQTGQNEDMAIYIYNPDDTRYQIYYQIESKPLLRNYDERNVFLRYANIEPYEYGIYANAPVIRLGTVETFYGVFNDYTNNIQSYSLDFADFHFPKLTNFSMQESRANQTTLSQWARSDATMRATFYNTSDERDVNDDNRADGIFTGTVISYSPSDVTGYYSIYGTAFVTAPDGELLEYFDMLQKVLASIKFTDEFSDTFEENENWDEHATDINSTLQESAANIASMWSERNCDYDIARQVWLDSQNERVRVMDTQTGKIYYAPKSFLADYSGDSYRPASDDEYLLKVSGEISIKD